MPRYLFNISDDDYLVLDREGMLSRQQRNAAQHNHIVVCFEV
jgi:hypothetical protein